MRHTCNAADGSMHCPACAQGLPPNPRPDPLAQPLPEDLASLSWSVEVIKDPDPEIDVVHTDFISGVQSFRICEGKKSDPEDVERCEWFRRMFLIALRRVENNPKWDDVPLPEDEKIDAVHPTRSGRHDLYTEAMRLVGARRSKRGLVDLVNWLLHQRKE